MAKERGSLLFVSTRERSDRQVWRCGVAEPPFLKYVGRDCNQREPR
jgi:hypothetical protein